MKHETPADLLAIKASFLARLSETARELSDAVDSLADATKWVEDTEEEIADALADPENFTAEEVEALRAELATKVARLAHKRKGVDLLEARLSNFKDDVTHLGEKL